MNDGISREPSSLSYISVDDVVDRVLQLGYGALLAKMDIKQAYRNVPVYPQDRILLGMRWQEQIYVDAALPFSLHSVPLIFTIVADAARWIMERKGVTHLFHYIDYSRGSEIRRVSGQYGYYARGLRNIRHASRT